MCSLGVQHPELRAHHLARQVAAARAQAGSVGSSIGSRMVLLRLALTVPILLAVSMVAFALARALPGDFAQASAGTTSISPEALATIRRYLGLE